MRKAGIARKRKRNPTSPSWTKNPLIWILGGGVLAWGGYMLLTRQAPSGGGGGGGGGADCNSLRSQLATLQAELQVANTLGDTSVAAQRQDQINAIQSQISAAGC